MTIRSWDQRLAHILVKPLVATPVHPNHLTGLSFVFGLTAAVLFAPHHGFLSVMMGFQSRRAFSHDGAPSTAWSSKNTFSSS